MTEPTAPASSPGVLARAIGVVTSPTATFAEVVRAPRWAPILLLVCAVVAIATATPQFTERGRVAALNMQVESIERFTGQQVSDEMYSQMEARTRYNGYITLVTTFIMMPIVALFFTALYWAIFNAVLGGTASFAQVLGIVTHSMVIGAIQAVAAAPIMLLQDQMSVTGPFNLGALLPMLDPESFFARFFSFINFFTLWQIAVVAIGLGVLYKRKPTPIAVALFAIYGLLVAAGVTLFSSFMSR